MWFVLRQGCTGWSVFGGLQASARNHWTWYSALFNNWCVATKVFCAEDDVTRDCKSWIFATALVCLFYLMTLVPINVIYPISLIHTMRTTNSLFFLQTWQEHLMILTRFPGRRFILARGLLHDGDLPWLCPPWWHLLLRLEACKAAHLPGLYVWNLGSLLSALAVRKPLPSLSRTHRPRCVENGSTGGSLYAASSLLVLKISYPGYWSLFVLCARKMWALWGNVVKLDEHPVHAFVAENVLSQE